MIRKLGLSVWLFCIFASVGWGQELGKVVSIQQAQIQKHEQNLQKLDQNVQNIAAKDSSTSAMQQIQAQAICTALKPGEGWTFAVSRSDPGQTCAQICGKLTEPQAGTLSCFNALHIYAANNPASTPQTIGLKTYRYNNCNGLSFGPNYCCCGN